MTGADDLQSRVAVHEHRLNKFEEAVRDIRDVIVKLQANIEIITRIDERQAAQHQAMERAFSRMAGMEKRLNNLETVVPVNTVLRNWGGKLAIGLILAGFSAMAGAIAAAVTALL